ncbi:MAG: hypothetical protein DDT38_00119 [Firmicutes bacterium]|nr:hypothetical protein [candidate division NPL-UPA2 bacterium]
MRTLILKTASPVSVSASPLAGNVNRTLEYLPGTAVRGALAANYLRSGAASHPDFQALFASNEVRYGNLYPYRGVPAQPVPLTAYSCKRHPGFGADNDAPHGVFDLMIDLLLWQETKGKAQVPEMCGYESACSMPLDSFSGFCLFNERDCRYESVKATSRQRGHTELRDETQAALAGSLYFVEMLNEGQRFAGQIAGNEPLLDKIACLLEEPLRLGMGQTRGLGKCSKEDFFSAPLRQLEPIGPQNGLAGRLCRLNAAIQQRGAEQTADKLYFTLTCHSDLIVRDRFLRYLSYLPLDAIQQSLPGADTAMSSFRPVGTIARTRLLPGWSSAWKLPKECAVAIAKGSVFVYGAERSSLGCFGGDNKVENALAKLLERLEQDGLGERRNEGFGIVVACDPFHYHRSSDEQLAETEKARL